MHTSHSVYVLLCNVPNESFWLSGRSIVEWQLHQLPIPFCHRYRQTSFTQWSKMGERHKAPIKLREMWHGRADRRSAGDSRSASSVPNFTFIWAEMWEYSPQNGRNLQFCPQICTSRATRLHNFYEILSVCTRLQVALKFLIWLLSGDKQPSFEQFSSVGALFHKYSIAPSGETTDRIK